VRSIFLVGSHEARYDGSTLLGFDGMIFVETAAADLRELLLPWHSREAAGTRRTPRRRTRLPIRIEASERLLTGVLLDVSPRGAGVLVSGELEPDADVHIAVGNDTCRGRVRWVRGGHTVHAGVELRAAPSPPAG